MDELSIEELVALISGIFLIGGALISGLTSFLTNSYNNKREDKRFEQKIELEKLQLKKEDKKFEQQLEHENKQQLRTYKMNQLYKVLIPIIEIYEEEKVLYDQLERNAVRIIGNGLQSDRIKDLDEIISENKRYVSVELFKLFSKVKGEHEVINEMNHMSSVIWHSEQRNEPVADFSFDDHGVFIEKIEAEASEIEKAYN